MNGRDYIKEISFRFIKQDVYCKCSNDLIKILTKINLPLEVINTVLPEDSKIMRKKLWKLLKIPKMSTFTIGAIINKSVSEMNDDFSFINVGVWQGFTLLAGMMDNPKKRCIGIDHCPIDKFMERFIRYKSPNHYFYDMDYRDYFYNKHKEKIGFYLYDGNHSYKNQLFGLQVAEPFFSNDCVIMIDDTNAQSPRQATLDFISGSSNKYQILLDETTRNNRHPTYWNGIMILQRTA